MMDNVKKEELIRQYIAAYNSFDVDSMLGLLHKEIVFKNVAGGETTAETNGLEEFGQLAQQSKQLFSSREQTITGIEHLGETVKISIDYQGVLAVDMPNGMKAGEALALKGASEFCFKDNLIIEITDIS